MPEENPCESAAASPVLDVTSLTEKPWLDTPARKAQRRK
jgi:hypothetical protein